MVEVFVLHVLLFCLGRANVRTYKPVHFRSNSLSSQQPHPQQTTPAPSSSYVTPATQSVTSPSSIYAQDQQQRTAAVSSSFQTPSFAPQSDKTLSPPSHSVSPQKSVKFTNHNTVFDADSTRSSLEQQSQQDTMTSSSARWTPTHTSSTSLKMDTHKS